MFPPSIIALVISGVLIFIATIKYLNYTGKIEGTQQMNLLLFFASSIAFHGLLHLGTEVFYGFNPLAGKFTVRNLKE